MGTKWHDCLYFFMMRTFISTILRIYFKSFCVNVFRYLLYSIQLKERVIFLTLLKWQKILQFEISMIRFDDSKSFSMKFMSRNVEEYFKKNMYYEKSIMFFYSLFIFWCNSYEKVMAIKFYDVICLSCLFEFWST